MNDNLRLTARPSFVGQPLIEVPFQSRQGRRIRCEVCPLYCTLGEGDIGVCGGRQVIGGKLIAVNYGQVCSLQIDPIEKKPLYHYYPGSEILSVGPNGCNLTCSWCQNWPISQNRAPTRSVGPEELADMVDAVDGIGAAYTYAEPLIWLEYLLDAGRVLRERDLVNVFITNGYINAEPLKRLLEVADAFNIDLKSSDDACYRHHCGGRLEDVQRTIRMAHDAGKHVEITHLVVTGVNDRLERIEAVAKWVAALDRQIPLHLTRFFPSHRYDEQPTDPAFLAEACDLARSYLDWVYPGNTTGTGLDSLCPGCGELLVKRLGETVEVLGIEAGSCWNCGQEVPFVMS
ncbi:MAG: AmmeMemoRadiSam system radical SAM enzyme [Calditrichaeota bacterium]|nr:AmmeMemoRadiSam system radical SAM enzyme [Calditrichota bacterium]